MNRVDSRTLRRDLRWVAQHPAGGPFRAVPCASVSPKERHPKSPQFQPYRLAFALFLLVLTTAPRRASAIEETPARIRPQLQGLLHNGTVVETRPVLDGRLSQGRSLNDFRRLTNAASSFDSPGQTPVRRLTLATGERIPVRLRGDLSFSLSPAPVEEEKSRTQCRVLLAGQPVVLLGQAVRSLAVPVAARDVVLSGWPMPDGFWSFREGEQRRVSAPGGAVLVPATGHLRRDLTVPAGPLFVELSVAWPAGDGSLEFLFEDDAGLRLILQGERILVRRMGPIRVSLGAASIRRGDLRVPSRLRLSIDAGVTLSLDGRVLARGSVAPRRLRSIVVRSSKSAAGPPVPDSQPVAMEQAGVPVVLGCLVQTRTKDAVRAAALRKQITVQTHDGDVNYGRSVRVGIRDVHLKTRFGEISSGWPEVRRVTLPRRSPRNLPSVSGEICRVELTSDSATAFFGPQPKFEITAGVRLTEDSVEIQHPLLKPDSSSATEPAGQGSIRLPWASVRRIEPLFRGEYRLLDAGPRHLGNRIHRSFTQTVPDGTTLTRSFVLDSIPVGPLFLSVEAAELEPASPETLRATPTLAELRDGFLTTRVFLNGTDAGSLNRHCRILTPIDQPARLRIPLPREGLKTGRNVIEFRQTPSRDDPRRFDDCELRRIAIEVEARP